MKTLFWIVIAFLVTVVAGGYLSDKADQKWLDILPKASQEKILANESRIQAAPKDSLLIMKDTGWLYKIILARENKRVIHVVDCRESEVRALIFITKRQVAELDRIVFPTDAEYGKLIAGFSCSK